MKKSVTVVAVIASAVVLAGCTETSVGDDKAKTDQQLGQYQQSQPIPAFSWSQERSTLIALVQARATTTATTTFFYNTGVAEPLQSCPSIGYPLASTAQLTNPMQVVGTAGAVIDQSEPTGIYTGESTGTYVVCVDPKGVKYPVYWEGFVYTVGGAAKVVDGKVVLDGDPTVVVEGKQ